MTTQELNALAPCPFCGGEPDVRTRMDEDIWTHNVVEWTGVYCAECDIGFDWPADAEPDAKEQWNTRTAATSQASVKAMREALEKRLDELTDLINTNRKLSVRVNGKVVLERDKVRRFVLPAIDNIDAPASVETATPAQEVVGYISQETLDCLRDAHGAGPIVAAAGYSTVIPLYAHPAPAPSGTEALRTALERVMAQTESDLASAHAEICKLQNLDPAQHSWPEWSPQANTLRWFKVLRNEYLSTPAPAQQAVDAEAK